MKYIFSCSRIGADMTKVGDKYQMFYVGNAKILHTVSNTINGVLKAKKQRIDPSIVSTEAPNVFDRIGADSYGLLYDVYGLRPGNMVSAKPLTL